MFDTEKLCKYCTFKSKYFIFQNKLVVSKDQVRDTLHNRHVLWLLLTIILDGYCQATGTGPGPGIGD